MSILASISHLLCNNALSNEAAPTALWILATIALFACGGSPMLNHINAITVRTMNRFQHHRSTPQDSCCSQHSLAEVKTTRLEHYPLVQARIIHNWESQDEPEHLWTIRDRLIQNEQRKGQLLGLYQQLLQAGGISADASPEQINLRLSGLVVEQQGKLTVYNRIYAAIFTQAWAETILASLRPYAEAISAWLASEQTDESRLLRGRVLQDALDWAHDRNLGNQDYQFLSAGQTLNMREEQEALELKKKALEPV